MIGGLTPGLDFTYIKNDQTKKWRVIKTRKMLA